MKTTKFAYYLEQYFRHYLPNIKGCTVATIDSYRHAFILFLNFMEEKNIAANKIEITDITYKNILNFLDWLQSKRKNSVSSRNHRQAVINSFIKFLMYEFPDYLNEFQAIINIPIKKAPKKEIAYLKTEGVKLLFKQINLNTKNGFRDYTMLMLMYTTGLRVTELINIKLKDVSLQTPATLLVHGKGQKRRYVPLTKIAVDILKKYINNEKLDNNADSHEWLFKNHMNEQFTRQGINYIVNKYSNCAKKVNPTLIPDNFSPHKMRHTTAMELVTSGVDLIYIRDLLGHVSVLTTEIYAKADANKKREAIELVSKQLVKKVEAKWEKNENLKDWLKSFNRRL